ncbi:MAG: hypothetical protein AVDCRST_MAG18-2026 [uncultured Thermomicrobiales bacterium]|uniref:YCII-related domain-containing protein n=1 Tax=uncultured Thermomicrobiales bacterium TaxID=1645740 RepID=A0A6J4VAE7_9BACT|nr:MAG: hypothetical protein AVDCRST_MAG18-2026 [uncultured Thermomicrobiales bacterium]
MAQFLLLIRGGDDAWGSFTPEQMEIEMGRYFTWTDELRSAGRLLASEQLHPGGQVIRERGGDLLVDGPFAETKENIGGFYLISAADATEAAEIAKGCPVLRHGGCVDLRAILHQ